MKKVLKAAGMLSLFMLFTLLLGYLIIQPNSATTHDSSFSKAERRLIQKGNVKEPMRVLNYFNTKDSILLRTPSKEITNFYDTMLEVFIQRLKATVMSPIHNGVGIAAPQVSVNKRIIIVQRFDTKDKLFEAYINPIIISYSDTFLLRPDACLSIPNVSGFSYRAEWIEIQYFDINGQQKQEKITDVLTSHIFQHEIDHLDGIIFLDRSKKQ
jgi:peptide deformylase